MPSIQTRVCVVAAAIITLCLVTAARAQLAGTPWPMFMHDTRHSGEGEVLGPRLGNPGSTLAPDSEVTSSLIIGTSGTILFGTSDEGLCAIDESGAFLWSYPTGATVSAVSTPAVGTGGSVYFGCANGCVYALDADGGLRWSYETDGPISASCTIDDDGSILIGSTDGSLYALEDAGTHATLVWSADVTYPITRGAATAGDDTVLFCDGGTGAKVYGYSSSGTRLWSTNLHSQIVTVPVVASDSSLAFVGTAAGTIYALSPDSGDVVWSFDAQAPISSDFALSRSALLIAGCGGGTVMALDTSYEEPAVSWQETIEGVLRTPPVLGPDGVAYFTSDIGVIYALDTAPDAAERVIFKYYLDYTPAHAPLIPSEGRLLVPTEQNGIAVIGDQMPPAPNVAVSPLFIDFGTVEVGQTSSATVSVLNRGAATLSVVSVSSSAPGAFVTRTAPFSLGPNEQRDLETSFEPSSEGDFLASITIASDDPRRPEVIVSVVGVAYQEAVEGPDFAITAEDIEFSQPQARPGDVITIDARIENIGSVSGEARIRFYYEFLHQLILIESVPISLDDGEDSVYSVDWVTDSGMAAQMYDIHVRIEECSPPDEDLSNNQAVKSYMLPVELAFITCTPGDGRVLVLWETASETDNLGFNVYRQALQSDFVKVNEKLISGAGTTAESNSYHFVDEGVQNGVEYGYYVESVSTSGETECSPVVFVTPSALHRGPVFELTSSQTAYKPGERVLVSVSVFNPGPEREIVAYWAVVMPDGTIISLCDWPGLRATLPSGCYIPEYHLIDFVLTDTMGLSGNYPIALSISEAGTLHWLFMDMIRITLEE